MENIELYCEKGFLQDLRITSAEVLNFWGTDYPFRNGTKISVSGKEQEYYWTKESFNEIDKLC